MRFNRREPRRARIGPDALGALMALTATLVAVGGCTVAGGRSFSAHTQASNATAALSAAPTALAPEPGAAADGVVREGETSVHTVHLEKGDYLEAHLDRDRYKVKFRLIPPGASEAEAIGWGELCAEPPGQTLWGLAGEAGDYRLTVSLFPEGSPGPYRITLLALHPAGEAEQARQAGEIEWELATAASREDHHQETLDHLNKTLVLWQKADYLRGIAATYERIGQILHVLSRPEEALPNLNRAVDLWEEAGDSRGVVGNLIHIAGLETNRHHWEAAEDATNRALDVAQRSAIPESIGRALGAICNLHRARGETAEALDTCHHAVAYWEDLGDLSLALHPLTNLGLMYRRMGEFDLARANYERVLKILADHPKPDLLAATYSNLGTLHYSLGEYQKALVEYQRALEMYQAQGNTAQVAGKYYNIGTVYQRMGNIANTLSYYERARDLQEQFDNTNDLVYTLLGIGWVHVQRGESALAVEPMTRALRLSRESGAKPLLVLALRRMAYLRLAEGHPEEALTLIEEGLGLARETRNRWEEAPLLDHRASAELELGRPDDALATLHEATRVNAQIGNWHDLADNHYRMAQIYRNRGELDTARQTIEQALAIADRAREQIDAQQVRSLVGATQQEYPGFCIDLLMELDERDPGAGHAAEAFRAAERSRARSLLEVLSAAKLDIGRGAPAELVGQRVALRRRLAAAERRRAELLNTHGEAPDQAALFQLKVDLDGLTTELAEVERKMRAASPSYASLTHPEPVTVDQVQRTVLDPETALLEFRLGEERSFLFLVTQDAFRTFELPARQILEQDARCVHWLLTAFADPDRATANASEDQERCLGSRAADFAHPPVRSPFEARSWRRRQIEQAYSEHAALLGERLLGDAARSGLLAGRRLAVVADGALEYVPFAALPEPGSGRPLVAGHELASLPSASVLAFQRRQPRRDHGSRGTLAIVADPLYGRDDQRVAHAESTPDGLRDGSDAGRYARLPFASEEAKAIAALAPAGETLLELGPDASKELVLGSGLSGYEYVHFAVHGVIDADYPALSRLVLSQVDAAGRPSADGSLRLPDIYDMRLDARMVVLSACETALGQEIRGEGLVGLARGFMYAGAERVVASLWRVQDVATASLMERFYGGLLEEGRDPADALRQAQLAMLSDPDGRFAFPYYWAGFVLQGDWR